MDELKPKTREELKGTPLCDAVLSSISELMRYHNQNQTEKCTISGCSGPRLYFAKSADITEFLQNHPENDGNGKIEDCLNKLESDDCITQHHTGGYLVN